MQIQSSVQQQTKVKVCDVLTLRTDEQNTHTHSAVCMHSAAQPGSAQPSSHNTLHDRWLTHAPAAQARGLHMPLSPLPPPVPLSMRLGERAYDSVVKRVAGIAGARPHAHTHTEVEGNQ